MANGFFCILYNILKNSLVDIFMRFLSYRLIKIDRKFTSADLLCDKASLRLKQHIDYSAAIFLLLTPPRGEQYNFKNKV
jgi:hypothetical protein